MLLGRAGAQAARAIPVSGASGECALEQKPRGASPFASAYVRRSGGSAGGRSLRSARAAPGPSLLRLSML